jgi:hypothetical protein
MVLRDALTTADIQHWHQIAVELLLEADPVQELGLGLLHSPNAPRVPRYRRADG